MASRGERVRLDLRSYSELTRGVTVSFAYLMPLLAVYEVGVWLSGLDLRNAAELSLKGFAGVLGSYVVWAQLFVLLGTIVVAWRLARRNVPALRIYPVFLCEATLLALLLGPLAMLLVHGLGLHPSDGAETTGARVLLSIGAGVYEELVFRFLLLAGGFALLHKALSVPRAAAFAIALVVSALLFSAYHHLGPHGEPFRAVAFWFRAIAGLLLGLLFAGRGLALCAYLHAFYDILCDLGPHGGAST
jgi:membrane protease YdiL (CAAX protease family)